MEICYSILDPTGNITALVESPVERTRYQAAAAAIMHLHPEVEQVGFSLPGRTDCPHSKWRAASFAAMRPCVQRLCSDSAA